MIMRTVHNIMLAEGLLIEFREQTGAQGTIFMHQNCIPMQAGLNT